MASLTPLSKGLIALAIIGGMASAVWHLALKEHFGARVDTAPAPASVAGQAAPTAMSTPPPPPPPQPAPAGAPPAPATDAATAAPPAAQPGPASGTSAADSAEQGRQALARGDYAQARTHLEQAVKAGSGAAACLLGDMTLKGQGGITASQERAAALYQQAQARNTICFAGS